MRRSIVLTSLVALIFCLSVGQAALAQFDDAPKMDSWVYQSFKMVYDAGLIKGYPDGTFRGSRPATRNEVVEFMARLMNYFEEKLASRTPDKPEQAAQPVVSNAEQLSEEDVKALIAEALAEQEENASSEELDQLSEDVFEAIQDLEEQFRDELDALDVRVTTLEEKVAALEEANKKQDEAIAQLKQDSTGAQGEVKKAKTMGIIGIILGVLGAVL